jgi:TRAP-type uncharacterized transport system substrate-binding protein
VYLIIKTIYSHPDEYKGVHAVLRQWTPKNAVRIHVSPFHPGAIRYFKETSVWTSEMEKHNQDLIAKRRR